MPQATNLVIKDATGTDKTFVLMTPASGDGGLAEWALKEGTISSVFPRITIQSTKRSQGRSRVVKLKFSLPSSFTDAVTGLTNVGSRAECNVSVTVPDDFPEALKDDHVAFFKNGIATALVQAIVRDALPAT